MQAKYSDAATAGDAAETRTAGGAARDLLTAMAVPPALLLLNGPEAGRRLDMRTLPCRIGRGGNSDLIVAAADDPPTVSREHLTLTLAGGELLVTDHSRNGTRVGERLLRPGESERLLSGQTLQLGPSLRLILPSACGAAAQEAASKGETRNEQASSGKALNGKFLNGKAGEAQAADRSACVQAAPAVYKAGQARGFLLEPAALQTAWKRVMLNRGGAGPDGVTIADFAQNADERLLRLQDLLRRGRYEPLPPRLFAAPKRSGGARTIAILSIQDRVVQQALHAALQPFLEPRFPGCSFAYRPGRGTQDALRRVDALLKQGLTWAAETDIADFFDSISHRILLDKLGDLVPDTFALSLAARCMAASAVAPGLGLAQGAATSPLFSNLYLAEFDRHLLAGGWNPVRYGDDLLIPCATRAQGQAALAEAEGYLRGRLNLALRAEKTALVPLKQGFTFLGFRFTEAGRQAAPEAARNLEARLREAKPGGEAAVLRGWKNYFGDNGADGTDIVNGANGADGTANGANAADSASGAAQSANNAADAAMRRLQTSPLPPPDDEWVARFLALFGGREEVYARQSGAGGAGAFVPCAGALTPQAVRRHVAGEETLAAYLLHTDGMTRCVVMDMDAAGGPGRPPKRDAPPLDLTPVIDFAQEAARVCRRYGLPAQLEDSGQKGRHLWLFFSEPVAPEAARRLARLLAARAGFPRPGVRLEILPRHTEWPGPQLGDAVKLPFGIHPVTARRCFLLDREGEAIGDRESALAGIRSVDAATVESVVRALIRSESRAGRETAQYLLEAGVEIQHTGSGDSMTTENGDAGQKQAGTKGKTAAKAKTATAAGPDAPASAVARLTQGCSVVRGLVERAQNTGHLRHTHQLILLYTAGHLGAEGAAFLHRTIALCRNYNPNICQSYIDRLQASHLPVSCRRIREWLEEEGETGLCTCSRSCRTPLENCAPTVSDGLPAAAAGHPAGGNPAVRARPQPSLAPAMENRVWTQIAADLFDADIADADIGEADIAEADIEEVEAAEAEQADAGESEAGGLRQADALEAYAADPFETGAWDVPYSNGGEGTGEDADAAAFAEVRD